MVDTPDDATPATPTGRPRGSRSSVFLPIGITFCVLGLIGFAADSMRPSGFAFLPIGITFLVLGMVVAGDDVDSADAGEAGEAPTSGPDVTPR